MNHDTSEQLSSVPSSLIMQNNAKQCKTSPGLVGYPGLPGYAVLLQGMDFGALGATLVLSSSALILSLLPQDNQQHHDQGQEPGYVGQFWWSRYVFLQFLRILGVARSTSAEMCGSSQPNLHSVTITKTTARHIANYMELILTTLW